MRFMIIVRATQLTESGAMPDADVVADMAAYHEELSRAGVLVDASGLQPSAKGWRIRYGTGQPSVIDGPFAETKELIAGFTLIEVGSRQEALEWTRRFPNPRTGEDCEVEVRQVYDLDDLPPSEGLERFRQLDAIRQAPTPRAE
ncbi:YciI family protein [Cupriavidus sp. AU9028]|uniref:YciI family protein n=1 Tax=Cupriavidus sp. AU9028 TaxID=2871157 RepID=UPI001C94096D|nr:YciI family protein [Cupriavidus sp. AU9028]MBY4899151.1 YciI family protein [Cupriavidus sp. AU9028]